MESKIRKIIIFGLILGLFFWRLGYIPPILLILECTLLWFIWIKFGFKTAIIVLPVLFLLNLQVNGLLGMNAHKFNFDIQRINLTKPDYIKIIDRYRYDDVGMPYKIRMNFYQNWQTVFLWIDSIARILSIGYLVRLLGFSGFGLLILGVKNLANNKRQLWLCLAWIFTVVASSGLAILLDTKRAWILASIPIVLLVGQGLKSEWFKKYQWWWMVILVVDVILK